MVVGGKNRKVSERERERASERKGEEETEKESQGESVYHTRVSETPGPIDVC